MAGEHVDDDRIVAITANEFERLILAIDRNTEALSRNSATIEVALEAHRITSKNSDLDTLITESLRLRRERYGEV